MNYNDASQTSKVLGSPPPHFTLVKRGYLAGDEVCTAEGCRTYPLAITRTILETG
jgi:hypothetical protein